eukprot:superscaffoldBa00005636_g20595
MRRPGSERTMGGKNGPRRNEKREHVVVREETAVCCQTEEAQVNLSRLQQVNEAHLESHKVNQTVGGAKLQLYKTTCCTEFAAAQEFNWNVFGDQKPDQPAVQEPAGTEERLKVSPLTRGPGQLTQCQRPSVMIQHLTFKVSSKLFQMSEDSFVYVFTLLYTPSPLGDSPIVRTRDVTVNIQCHYQRKHDVSSGLLKPTWTPFSDVKATEENLYFSLRLMTDDWQFPRPSTQFLLGDMMKFEVSVKQFHHTPLRVTVDSCVATIVPNIDTVPRYSFLGNNGCLFDSQLTGSSSKFLPRSQDDRLQFELEAFRFQQDDSGLIYITCSLRATAATAAVDSANKACSFSNGWSEASGSHHACSCCDTDCGTGSQLTGSQWEQETAVGPIIVKERPLR